MQRARAGTAESVVFIVHTVLRHVTQVAVSSLFRFRMIAKRDCKGVNLIVECVQKQNNKR